MSASAGEVAAGQQQIVRLEQVSKHFVTGVAALSGVDLTVTHGEFLSLVGPSGCGKSTLLRIIAGLSPLSGGHCHVAISPNLGRRSSAGRIGFVFQDPTLMPWSTVTANVLLPFRIARRLGPTERDRAHEAIRAVGLTGFEEAYPHQLSGGMRMRVSIARALATEPDLLLLDEPFAALDEITRMALNDDLLRLWDRYRPTILFVTHSVFESVYLSSRIAVMTPRPGRIIADFAVDLPYPRSRATRTSPDYGAMCERVSTALADGIASGSAAA